MNSALEKLWLSAVSRLPGSADVDESRGIDVFRQHRRRIIRIVSMCTAITAVALLVVALHYVIEVREARHDTPEFVASALAFHGTDVDIGKLSPERENVLSMVEDPAFRRHRGVDLMTPGAGMTTLTQSLLKQLYFPWGSFRAFAKIRQSLIAQHALDALVSKDDQLQLFLNIAYLKHHHGAAVHGFGQAARTYFGKTFLEMTDDEFLSLVAALINPNSLKPGTPANTERAGKIRRYTSGDYEPVGVMDLEYRGGEASLRFSALKLVTLT